jgi:hypothetical protein
MRSIDLARKAFGTGPSEWLPVCLFARRGHTVFWALSSIALCAQEAHVLVRILSKLQYTRSQSCLAPTVSARFSGDTIGVGRGSDTLLTFALRAVERVISDQSRTNRETINQLWDILDNPHLNKALGLPQNSRMTSPQLYALMRR